MIPTMDDKNPVVNHQPCGCATAVYEDGRNIYAPCIACGLFKAADPLMKARWWNRGRAITQAGLALAAVATTIQRQNRQRVAQQSTVDAIKKKV